MEKRRLGTIGPQVSAIGLGCMGMSEFYGKSHDTHSKEVILTAVRNGITMLDTADTYGNGHNEELIALALKEWHDEVFIATKFGMVREPGAYKRTVNGHPEYVRKAAEASLRRLNREVIDLYYIHRVDITVPIEETIGAMSDLVKQGKVRYIGISESSASTIRKAHAVHPLAAVQTEYSLWTRHVEKEVLPTLRKLGIGFVAYSPLGRGFLTGKLNRSVIEQEGDFRNYLPRMQGENYDHNFELVRKIEMMAERKGITGAQLVLGWVLSKGEDIIPIPGTRQIKYLVENIEAVDIPLSANEVNEIESSFPPDEVKGERYTQAGMLGIDG